MLFPVSGVSVNPLVPFAVAFLVSFFTSMGGVSGAFLLLPFQMSFLGYTTPSVSATNHVFNIVAIPSGVYRYIREGRMLWPLTWAVIIGTLPGVFIGAWVRIIYLPDSNDFKLFVGMVLLYIGWRILRDVVVDRTISASAPKVDKPGQVSTVRVTTTSFSQVSFEYDGQSYSFSPVVVYGICFVVGVIGGVYGIGGGSIVAPFFVTIVGLPVFTIAGAALMGTFVTSVAGVAFYHLLSGFYPHISVEPDWQLGLIFGAGGMVGMYLGARAQKWVSGRVIKGILTFCVLFVALRYITGFF